MRSRTGYYSSARRVFSPVRSTMACRAWRLSRMVGLDSGCAILVACQSTDASSDLRLRGKYRGSLVPPATGEAICAAWSPAKGWLSAHQAPSAHCKCPCNQVISATEETTVTTVQPNIQPKTVGVIVIPIDVQAWEFAELLKRMSFSDFRTKGRDKAEAYTMQSTPDQVAAALRDAGYSPR